MATEQPRPEADPTGPNPTGPDPIGPDRSGTDPRTLRAVAHPLRLDLLHLLRLEGPLTASQCAERLRTTPKLCSYHLQLLGKYGLIEETGDGKGRARPWRIVPFELGYIRQPDEDPTTSAVADTLARTMLQRDGRVIETFIAERHRLGEEWRNVAAMSSSPLRLTSEQLAALSAELLAVVQRYTALDTDTDGETVASERGAGDSAGDTGAGRDGVRHPVHVAVYAVPVLRAGPPGSDDPQR